MSGDHHGRTARRATLLVTATDDILGTHRQEIGVRNVRLRDSQPSILATTKARCGAGA